MDDYAYTERRTLAVTPEMQRPEIDDAPIDVALEIPWDLSSPMSAVAQQDIHIKSLAMAKVTTFADMFAVLEAMADSAAEDIASVDAQEEEASGVPQAHAGVGNEESPPAPCGSGRQLSGAERPRAASCMAGSYALSMRRQWRQQEAHGTLRRGRSVQRVPVPPKAPPSNRRRGRAVVGGAPPSAASVAA
mmetsp:Transcript_5834/g.16160  ORF Transcript_5834/g.16160 Transcript_5834/m.16160 type:complete len:190 (-) Transcript_5834:334-903(-)|eukprot:CAMPEP_0179037576 /NCGR_PEP_ID=MMETSP0796-20121207/14199_1 /TAXON_ID=73915 /ORGANISM="Pyrodinium bahamense, Strain pbaha01" /LENGTH=189 /DNA_ID=CAMNT_0020733887 /DNA_START=99 /DNA_END=668 /DNA_ORIENTATION=-